MPPGLSIGRLARARIGPAEGAETARLELQDRPLGRTLQPYGVHGVQPIAQLGVVALEQVAVARVATASATLELLRSGSTGSVPGDRVNPQRRRIRTTSVGGSRPAVPPPTLPTCLPGGGSPWVSADGRRSHDPWCP
jgi:hypothetical protein